MMRALVPREAMGEEMHVRKWIGVCVTLALLLSGEALPGRQSVSKAAASGAPTANDAALQTETDEYTRYELLAPESASFRIRYEVTATTAGAKYFYNPIRKGSVASDEAVYDAMTGEALPFEIVSGQEARKDPLMPEADVSESFIKIHLARAVPPEGRGRLLIVKTYKDPQSYYREGGGIVFNRGLGT